MDLSAAEVIRRIFRMAAEERQSDYPNALGVPTTGLGAGRDCASQSETAARWRAGRVRNLLISTVYKGPHRGARTGAATSGSGCSTGVEPSPCGGCRKLITHPYPNFLYHGGRHGGRGTPTFPPVIRLRFESGNWYGSLAAGPWYLPSPWLEWYSRLLRFTGSYTCCSMRGSSLMSTLMCLGMLLSVSEHSA